ncbi:class F sortase [Candidatus Kaiserbacteria bacterium]|nr:MAG: class F sortase [Candidatus Kaiserbacteria bacterium]
MANVFKNIRACIANRQYQKVVAFAVAGMVVGALSSLGILFLLKESPQQAPTSEVPSATTSVAFSRSAPTRISIPKIEVEATFEKPLGLKEDKTIEVPDSYTQVGWYKNGPTPGEVGAAVVLGHVDSYKGPAVFWPLRKLEAGDEIEITREDGSVAVFTVDSLARYSQDDFPTELVYGSTDTPTLRLVTCTGTYDKGEEKYSHNLVVYASLKQ